MDLERDEQEIRMSSSAMTDVLGESIEILNVEFRFQDFSLQ